MTTARDIITKAMQKIGALVKNEAPSADEANDALASLNMLMASYSNDSMLIYARSWETFAISGGDGEYTIGTGGDLSTTRPIFIVQAYIRDGVTDYPLSFITDETYNEKITQKSTQGIPVYYNYDNANPLSKIRLYPVPAKAYSLFLLSEKPLTEFTLDSEIILPKGWERFLTYALALELAPEYGMQLDAVNYEIYKEAKNMVMNAVNRNRTMDALPLVKRYGNFNSGWF